MEENIGCRISRLRKAQDIGVYQLAEQARVSAQTVYRWEHGNVANIKESILERLAPILGVTKYYIKRDYTAMYCRLKWKTGYTARKTWKKLFNFIIGKSLKSEFVK